MERAAIVSSHFTPLLVALTMMATGQAMMRLLTLTLLVAVVASSPLRRKRKNLVFIEELFGGADQVADTMLTAPEEADEEEAGDFIDIDFEYRLLEGSFCMSLCMSMPSSPSPKPPTGPQPPSGPAPTPRPPSGPATPTPDGPPSGPTSPTTPTTPAPPTTDDCLAGTTKAAYLEEELSDVPGFSTDPSTDEGKAFDWFVNTDTVDVCTYDTLEQRYALASFYFSTGGPDWTSSTGWTTASPECEWQFVTCNGDGDVTSLLISKYIVCFLYKTKMAHKTNTFSHLLSLQMTIT